VAEAAGGESRGRGLGHLLPQEARLEGARERGAAGQEVGGDGRGEPGAFLDRRAPSREPSLGVRQPLGQGGGQRAEVAPQRGGGDEAAGEAQARVHGEGHVVVEGGAHVRDGLRALAQRAVGRVGDRQDAGTHTFESVEEPHDLHAAAAAGQDKGVRAPCELHGVERLGGVDGLRRDAAPANCAATATAAL
jgi:hypothetical protein